MKFNIGLFGGTFDPVHNGHIEIARSYLNSSYIDQLWIIPSANPPHKSNLALTPFEHRVNMLKLVFNDVDGVLINNIEQKLPAPGYTLQTLNKLKESHESNYTFYWCIGSDSLQSFHEWYRYKDILKLCMLLVAERPEFEIESVEPAIQEKCIFVKHDPVTISSTEIRNDLISKRFSSNIPGKVAEYILTHNLYR